MPWSDNENLKEIYKEKATTFPEKLCKGISEEFDSYFDYLWKLPFHSVILVGFFKKMMDDNGYEKEYVFD